MIEVKGKYNTTKVFIDIVEKNAMELIKKIANEPSMKDNTIRIMPDVHYGKGCNIGTTMKIKDKIVPNLVGGDLNCGVKTIKIKNKKGITKEELIKLDEIIHNYIPSGMEIRNKEWVESKKYIRNYGSVKVYKDFEDIFSHYNFRKLKCYKHITDSESNDKFRYFKDSLGTLGGGNHFVEVEIDNDDNIYITVHTGSRNLGNKVAKYYQKQAICEHYGHKMSTRYKEKINEIRDKFKETPNMISEAIKNMKRPPKDLCYLEKNTTGEFENYIHDTIILKDYANANRDIILNEIIDRMGWEIDYSIETLHNYVDSFYDNDIIVRKGAVSARKNEMIVIPMNMRDGVLICRGKGNYEWNFSAPHGSGRVFSRTEAKNKLDINKFKDTMKGIYTTSVNESTIDESPFVYKPMNIIVESIKDTVDIVKILKPVYNFKASENIEKE